jgi:hypothetical protein
VIKHRDIALGPLFEMQGAFNRTLFDTIKLAAERHGIEPAICRWICSMLEGRNINHIVSGDPEVSVVKRCPQGGVLLPLF